MAGGSNQAFHFLLVVSLIICLSGVVNAQGKGSKLKQVCDKVASTVTRLVKREKCDLTESDAALIAIWNGAVHVALKLDANGMRKANRMTDLVPVDDTESEGIEDNSRRKRDAEDDRRKSRLERVKERVAKIIPKCLKVDESLIKVCKKARAAGYICGRAMTFKPLGVMLLGENSEEIDVDIIPALMAKRKVKAGVVGCTNQAMIQINDGDLIPVNQVNLEYNTRIKGVNVTIDAEMNFLKQPGMINGMNFSAGTLKTNFKISIKCPEGDADSTCNQIQSIRVPMLINIGVKRRGIYRCEGRTCNVPFVKEAVVEIDRTYLLDGLEKEVPADAMTYDNNVFTITFHTPMNGRRERTIFYDPTMAASVEMYTGSEEEDNILVGDPGTSTAARGSVCYPMVICTILLNILVRFL